MQPQFISYFLLARINLPQLLLLLRYFFLDLLIDISYSLFHVQQLVSIMIAYVIYCLFINDFVICTEFYLSGIITLLSDLKHVYSMMACALREFVS